MGGTDITNDGCIGPKSTAFYELRAKGGAGAVTVSECMVHPKTDGSHAYHLDESILNSLACATYTADAIRRHGAMPSLELSHSGMYAGTYMTDKNKQKSMNQWGPSDTVRPDGVDERDDSRDRSCIWTCGRACKTRRFRDAYDPRRARMADQSVPVTVF